MSTFPNIAAQLQMVVTSRWLTAICRVASFAHELRSQKWQFPLRTIAFPLRNLTADQILLLYDFYANTCHGTLPFRFVWPVSEVYTKEYVGKSTGSQTTWTLPCTAGSAPTTIAYVNNVETSGTFSSGTGPDGLDQFIFDPAPISGSIITASFTGQWSPRVRFLSVLSLEYILRNYMTVAEISLEETICA